jgi:hypothetical protein
MNKGILIFAHNSDLLDYGSMAIVSGVLAKKNLKLPVSLVTDKFTIDQLKLKNRYELLIDTFDKVIEIDKPVVNNYRRLENNLIIEKTPFINGTRPSAYDLTPYHQTLLIDSDFLIFTNRLNNYWDLDSNFLISRSMNDLIGDRIDILDKQVSDTGVRLYWATTVMFKKSSYAKNVFNLVNFIKENYKFYADFYKFDHRQYRNDISFSIAKHILDGFDTDSDIPTLPSILTVQDIDTIEKVCKNGRMIFSIKEDRSSKNYIAASLKDTDIHIMNKLSILNHFDSFLTLS